MSLRSLCTSLLFAAASLVAQPLHADELADIEKLYHEGKVNDALALADATIAAQPRAAQVRFLKGVMLIEQKREDEALKVFTALTQDYPELADPYNNLAVLYAAKGQLPNALVALQNALRNEPEHRLARENLGDLYLMLAQQAWAAAQARSKGDDAEMVRKLRLAGEILPASAASAPTRVLKPRTSPTTPVGSPFRRSQGLDSISGR